MHTILRTLIAYVLCIHIALVCNTTDIEAHKKCADAYAQEENFLDAAQMYMYCYLLDASDKQLLFDAASCLLKIGHIDEAISLYEALFEKHPVSSIAYNIAYTYKVAGNLEEAIRRYEKLLTSCPDHDAAHLGLGYAYLQQGDFVRGWKQHSRYLRSAGKNGDALRALLQEGTIRNKKIVLHYEGGLGDTIMFIRYAERLKKCGAHITCVVQKPLVPLLSTCPYIDALITNIHEPILCDAKSSLMSLPAIFEDTEETFPVSIPYVRVDEALTRSWRTKIDMYQGPKIGICWQSDVHNDVSRLPIARRGIPLDVFTSLLCDPRYTFFNLQQYDGTEQIATLAPTCRLVCYPDMDKEHGAFMDTAALIQNLDLVISIDSAVAHLAGALGIPTLLVLPYSADWRWIVGRTDSPWYPHHIIFKQPAPFDWESVVQQVTKYLEHIYTP